MSYLIAFLIAVIAFTTGCLVMAILSRVNNLEADELDPEPLGEMVDIRDVVRRYGE